MTTTCGGSTWLSWLPEGCHGICAAPSASTATRHEASPPPTISPRGPRKKKVKIIILGINMMKIFKNKMNSKLA